MASHYLGKPGDAGPRGANKRLVCRGRAVDRAHRQPLARLARRIWQMQRRLQVLSRMSWAIWLISCWSHWKLLWQAQRVQTPCAMHGDKTDASFKAAIYPASAVI